MTRLIRMLGVTIAAVLIVATSADAKFGLENFSVTFNNEDGSPARVAGSHPFAMNTTLEFNTTEDPEVGEQVPDGDAKAMRFHLPPGFIGSLNAVPRCNSADFLDIDEVFGLPACANSSALGVTWLKVIELSGINPYMTPVYNLVAPPGVAAKIGFIVSPKVPVTVEIKVNDTSPNNVVAGLLNMPNVVRLYGAKLQVWGVPGDAVHDPYRGTCLNVGRTAKYGELASKGSSCSAGAARLPFLTLPRSCNGP